MSGARPARPRPRLETAAVPPPAPERTGDAGAVPFLLDFLPLQGERDTRLARFYERLKAGRLSTTRCRRDGTIAWPPRTACPRCHAAELDWVDLPSTGTLYAFSAVLGGAPLGMEAEVPFAVGLVDLDGVPLRLFGRVVGRPWTELAVGEPVAVESYSTPDGRVYYRFRAGASR